MGAPFQVAQMTIIMMTGTHYMLRTNIDYYMQYRTDTWSQNLQITVKSEDPANPVTINYKLRDKFQFLVGAGLTLQDLIFKAADSVMTPSIDTYGCLASTTQCCSVSGSSLTGSQCTGFVR